MLNLIILLCFAIIFFIQSFIYILYIYKNLSPWLQWGMGTAVVISLTVLNHPPLSPMGASTFVFILVAGAGGVWFMLVVGVRIHGGRCCWCCCPIRVRC